MPQVRNRSCKGEDMMPGEFSFDQWGIKEKSTVIIQASNQTPLILSIGREFVAGGIMPNKLPRCTGLRPFDHAACSFFSSVYRTPFSLPAR